MSLKFESLVSQPVKLAFVSTGNTTGLTTFSNVWLLRNGIPLTGITTPVLPTITYSEVGNGLYVATFTPTMTGTYELFIQANIQASVNVVDKSIYTFLQNLEDCEMGSWTWNKTTNTMTFIRQTGITFAGFDVTDTLTSAGRERTIP